MLSFDLFDWFPSKWRGTCYREDLSLHKQNISSLQATVKILYKPKSGCNGCFARLPNTVIITNLRLN